MENEMESVISPKVSVVMPVYNSAKYLRDAIESIIAQTFTDWEFLIINEFGSDDGSKEIIEGYAKQDRRIILIQNKEKLGLAESLNYGFKVARGKYIARLDADDLAHADRLEKQYRLMENNLDIGICGSYQHHFGKNVDWVHKPPTSSEMCKASFLFNCDICHSTLMLRRETIQKYNLYYDKNFLAEDYELWTRACRVTKFINIPEILGEYRWEGENITIAKKAKLNTESSYIVVNNIKKNFNINIPENKYFYFEGWENPFNKLAEKQREIALDDFQQILRELYKINLGKKIYDKDALLQVIARKWFWAKFNAPWDKEHEVYCLDQVFTENYKPNFFIRLNVFCQHNKTIKAKIKKVIKVSLRFFLKPLNNYVENKLLILEESIKDFIEWKTWDRYQRISNEFDEKYQDDKNVQKEAEKSINKRLDYIEKYLFNIEKKLNYYNENISQNMDARIWKAEENISQNMDARVWKAEEALYEAGKKIRGDIWNLSFNLEEKKNSKEIQNNFRYNELFYTDNRFESYLSAYHVLKKLLPQIKPQSVCDLGCGTGTWLYIANKMGVKDIVGFDGDYVDRNWLMIPQEYFIPADLSKQIKFTQKYDLAFSLEVAEHIDAYYADVFVSNLCAASDLVLFSAAHPGQGGDGHVNEQPEEYWENKFGQHGFEKIEIRNLFKENRDICWWYRDNICLYRKNK